MARSRVYCMYWPLCLSANKAGRDRHTHTHISTVYTYTHLFMSMFRVDVLDLFSTSLFSQFWMAVNWPDEYKVRSREATYQICKQDNNLHGFWMVLQRNFTFYWFGLWFMSTTKFFTKFNGYIHRKALQINTLVHFKEIKIKKKNINYILLSFPGTNHHLHILKGIATSMPVLPINTTCVF